MPYSRSASICLATPRASGGVLADPPVQAEGHQPRRRAPAPGGVAPARLV